MSIPQLDLVNQTSLIPQFLTSITSNSDQSIEINATSGIILGTLLNTTPIFATIGQNGITTTNPNGFDILSKLNMNSQNINNVDTITATTFVGSLTGSATNSTTNTITDDNTNATFYPVFVSNNTGNLPLKVDRTTNPLSYNPSTGNLIATTFVGSLTGSATNSTTNTITDDNTNATFYPVFVSNNTGNLPLKVDKTTNPLSYNPSTGNLIATTFTGSCSTTGLVFLQTLSGTITGAITPTTFILPSIFNSTYKNYKIQFTFGENSFTSYPSVSLNGYSGIIVPTTGDLYGYDMILGSLTAISLTNQTLSTNPLQLTGSCLSNCHLEFDIFNVGYTTLHSNNIIRIVCNSTYNNPTVKGIRNITAMTVQNSSSTITGLSLQTIMGATNNPTWIAKVYGYK